MTKSDKTFFSCISMLEWLQRSLARKSINHDLIHSTMLTLSTFLSSLIPIPTEHHRLLISRNSASWHQKDEHETSSSSSSSSHYTTCDKNYFEFLLLQVYEITRRSWNKPASKSSRVSHICIDELGIKRIGLKMLSTMMQRLRNSWFAFASTCFSSTARLWFDSNKYLIRKQNKRLIRRLRIEMLCKQRITSEAKSTTTTTTRSYRDYNKSVSYRG